MIELWYFYLYLIIFIVCINDSVDHSILAFDTFVFVLSIKNKTCNSDLSNI